MGCSLGYRVLTQAICWLYVLARRCGPRKTVCWARTGSEPWGSSRAGGCHQEWGFPKNCLGRSLRTPIKTSGTRKGALHYAPGTYPLRDSRKEAASWQPWPTSVLHPAIKLSDPSQRSAKWLVSFELYWSLPKGPRPGLGRDETCWCSAGNEKGNEPFRDSLEQETMWDPL